MPKLTTDRTILLSIDIEMIRAISGGTLNQVSEYHHNDEWPENDLKEALPVFIELLQKNGNDGFNIWLIIEKDNNQIIGSAGFIGQPDSKGNIEIGFGIIPSKRKKGYCYESVQALVDWGINHNDVKGIIARCDTSNTASKKTMMRLGFACMDENDNILTWHYPNKK